MDCRPPGSPGKNTGVGGHFLLQGIFLTQGLNPGLLQCRQVSQWGSYIYIYMTDKDLFRFLVILNKPGWKENLWEKEMLNFSKTSKRLVSDFCYFNSRHLSMWWI